MAYKDIDRNTLASQKLVTAHKYDLSIELLRRINIYITGTNIEQRAKEALASTFKNIIRAVEKERNIAAGIDLNSQKNFWNYFSETDMTFVNLLNILNGTVSVADLNDNHVKVAYNYVREQTTFLHEILVDARSALAGDTINSSTQSDKENIASILPQPAPAPINVSLIDGRLTLISSRTLKGSLSSAAVERIREGIHEILENALNVLGTQHNADPRFAPSCQPFLRHLGKKFSEISVESLGMNWQIVSQIFEDTRETLPSPVTRQIEQVLKSTNILLSQYQEWREYIGAEAVAGITNEDLEKLANEVVSVADDIAASPAVVDFEIRSRFLEIINAPLLGVVRVESISVPLINSLSNYFSEIVKIVINESPWIVDASTAVAQNKMTQNTVLIFALAVLGRRYPEISKLPMFKFLSDGYDFAIKQFPWAKDTLLK